MTEQGDTVYRYHRRHGQCRCVNPFRLSRQRKRHWRRRRRGLRWCLYHSGVRQPANHRRCTIEGQDKGNVGAVVTGELRCACERRGEYSCGQDGQFNSHHLRPGLQICGHHQLPHPSGHPPATASKLLPTSAPKAPKPPPDTESESPLAPSAEVPPATASDAATRCRLPSSESVCLR